MTDPLHQIDTTKLDPDFLTKLRALLAALVLHNDDSWVATFGFRSWDQQNTLYQKYLAGGPLAAPPGRSAHEHGLAVDLLAFRDGAPVKDGKDPAYQTLRDLAQRYGLETLYAYGDAGHVQLQDWKVRAQFQDVPGDATTIAC